MKEALWYEKAAGGRVRCLLCPHQCLIQDRRRGICEVRENRDGVLYTLNYHLFSSVSIDPIEKKPLYHFHPGRIILSAGSFGCNLRCGFCQNHEISQLPSGAVIRGSRTEPSVLAEEAERTPDNIGLAYTYNEPVVSFETVLETARLIRRKKLKNVMVTNGYISPGPLEELLACIDAFNVDLKSFDDHFYHHYTSSRLAPVKENLKSIRLAGKHLELTNLVIPGLNDDESRFAEMVTWIAVELGKDTPLHLSRYFPRHRFTLPPTPEKTLVRLFEIARHHLDHVYIGNLYTPFGQDTVCPSCRNTLIARSGYHLELRGVDEEGRCEKCRGKQLIINN